MADVRVFEDLDALSHAAAEQFVEAAAEAIAQTRRFVVALAGGSTPRTMYESLAAAELAAQVDWGLVHVAWGDERCVAPDDARSNSRMAREAFLDRVPISEAHVHRIKGELGPEAGAADYERVLHELFVAGRPRFDLVLLGLGKDGHTASLFPRDPTLRERTRWVAGVEMPDVEPRVPRVTLTLPVINAAGRVWFLVAGSGKCRVLRAVLDEPGAGASRSPAAMVQPAGELVWFVDRTAYR